MVCFFFFVINFFVTNRLVDECMPFQSTNFSLVGYTPDLIVLITVQMFIFQSLLLVFHNKSTGTTSLWRNITTGECISAVQFKVTSQLARHASSKSTFAKHTWHTPSNLWQLQTWGTQTSFCWPAMPQWLTWKNIYMNTAQKHMNFSLMALKKDKSNELANTEN